VRLWRVGSLHLSPYTISYQCLQVFTGRHRASRLAPGRAEGTETGKFASRDECDGARVRVRSRAASRHSITLITYTVTNGY
jgi:hypothetical protein